MADNCSLNCLEEKPPTVIYVQAPPASPPQVQYIQAVPQQAYPQVR